MKPIYLFVTPFFPSENNWRGEYCYDLVKSLEKTERYDVRVFMPGLNEDYEYGGVHVCGFKIKMLPSTVLPFFFIRHNQRSFLAKVSDEGIDWEDVAVCHVNIALLMPYALAAKAKNPNCHTILYHYDQASFGLNLGRLRHVWLHKFILFRQLRKMHDAMDLHLFVCGASEVNFRAAPKVPERVVYDDYIRQMYGLGWMRSARVQRSLMLHLGVNVEKFQPRSAPKANDTFVIGCIANFQVLKDHMTLLKALERVGDQLGNWQLRLVGSGETKAMCETFVREHGLSDRVTFEREVRHDALPSFYQSLDLFVLPSLFEGIGTVTSEAAACGVPFIACQGQGMDDLLTEADRQRWFFMPRDVQGLAERLVWFCRERPPQSLVETVDFDGLMAKFVDDLDGVRW